MIMWLIIVLLIIAGCFFGFELWQFISSMKRRKQKKNLNAKKGVSDNNRKEVN